MNLFGLFRKSSPEDILPMNPLQKALVMSLIRHGLTFLAGFLVTNGYLQANAANGFVEQMAGAAVALLGVGMSWYEKHQHHAA